MKKSILLYLTLFYSFQVVFSQKLAVQVTGQGPDIILIPGLASSGEVWDDTVVKLAKNHTCHVLTLPGFAGNDPVDIRSGFIPAMDSLIADYIRTLNGKVILIGHSLGGFLSLHLTKALPDKVSKTIIVDSFPFYSAAFNPAATEELMKPQAQMLREMMQEMTEADFKVQQEAGMRAMTADSTKIPLLLQWSLDSDRASFAQAFYDIMTMDFRGKLSSIDTPILVLGSWYAGKEYGQTEESVRAHFESQYRLAPQATVKMAPNARHFIMWDNPEWYMQQLLGFIQ